MMTVPHPAPEACVIENATGGRGSQFITENKVVIFMSTSNA